MNRRVIFLIALGLLVTFLVAQFPYAVAKTEDKAHLLYMSIWAIVLSGSALAARQVPLGDTLKYGLIWLVIILALVLGYSYKNDILNSRLGAELMPNRLRAHGDGTLSLRAREGGHFFVEAEVNGVPVNFMIDTGASDVTLSKEDAQRAGLSPETLSYTRQYSTANGIIGGAPVRLSVLQIGPLRLHDFPASVNGGQLDTSLLGMEALNALGGFHIQDDTMVIGRK